MSTAPSPATVEIDRLRGIRLFSNLSTPTLQRIAALATVRCYPPATHVLLQDDDCSAAYFVISGEVRVYRVSSEGREQVLVRLGAGQAFNTVAVFQGASTNPANVVTLSEAVLCVVSRDDLLQVVRTRSDLAMMLLRDFADRLAHFTDLVESLALHSVQQRLARFLLDRASAPADNAEGPGGREKQAEVRRWTQHEIAGHLGTVRDVIGRELRAMEEAGILRIERGRIVLLSREGLAALAGR